MFIPVTCMSCGMPLDHIGELFEEMYRELVTTELAKRNIKTSQAAVDSGLHISCEPLFEQFHIKNYCCRKSLITTLNILDYF